jgi:hypothetical protein
MVGAFESRDHHAHHGQAKRGLGQLDERHLTQARLLQAAQDLLDVVLDRVRVPARCGAEVADGRRLLLEQLPGLLGAAGADLVFV